MHQGLQFPHIGALGSRILPLLVDATEMLLAFTIDNLATLPNLVCFIGPPTDMLHKYLRTAGNI